MECASIQTGRVLVDWRTDDRWGVEVVLMRKKRALEISWSFTIAVGDVLRVAFIDMWNCWKSDHVVWEGIQGPTPNARKREKERGTGGRTGERERE